MKGFDDSLGIYSGEVLTFSIALTLLFQKPLKSVVCTFYAVYEFIN